MLETRRSIDQSCSEVGQTDHLRPNDLTRYLESGGLLGTDDTRVEAE